jgi:hypothetical protein
MGDVQVRARQGKGVGWDPPIPMRNKEAPCGSLIVKVGPLSHPGLEVCQLGRWGL